MYISIIILVGTSHADLDIYGIEQSLKDVVYIELIGMYTI